ncbi:hypothetical protein ACFTZB_19365 [Rhodococcus sp. NPDC057014]|uniref:hypothetical protein n=1 Tax=Rhodococcus sp. NPDC057014 TaxID=3346000 RepID=UPI00362F456C
MDRLDRAVADFNAALAAVEEARAELHSAIVGALDEGVIQAEIVRRTGYTRERVRQIARAAGREGGRSQ